MPEQNALVTDITVAEITAPQLSKAGKLMPARIKDTKGRVWNVWKDKFEQLDVGVGKTYAAMYTSTPYSFVNPHTGAEQTGENRTIVGLNPLGAAATNGPATATPQAADVVLTHREESIAVNGKCHNPHLTQIAETGDIGKLAKIYRVMRLAERQANKEAVMMPSGAGGDFDDEIPY